MLRDRLRVNNAKACHNTDRQTREVFVLDVDVIDVWIILDAVQDAADHDDVGLDLILLGSKVEVSYVLLSVIGRLRERCRERDVGEDLKEGRLRRSVGADDLGRCR